MLPSVNDTAKLFMDPYPARDLHGQVALVTGASSGIGCAVALALARHGVHVCLVGRDATRLGAVDAEVRSFDGKSSSHSCDLGNDQDLQELAAEVLALHQRIDILVHSAGVITLGAIESTSVEDFDLNYRVNVRAPFLLTKLLIPAIRSACGQIVFINSSVGIRTKESVGAYAVSKHALKALADTLRMEINTSGVRVLNVFPGNTATDMQRAIQTQTGNPYHPDRMLQADDVAEATLGALRMPVSAEITDIHIRPMRKS